MYDSDCGGDTCLECGRMKKGGSCDDPASCPNRVSPTADDVIFGSLNSGNPNLSPSEISHPFPEHRSG